LTASVSLLPTHITEGQGPGMAFRIEGQIVPVLHLALNGQMPVYFEHHVVLWKQPQIDIQLMRLPGAFKRVLAGMPIMMTQAVGYGEIAFSRDSAGQVFPLTIPHGQGIYVREHQFLAATMNLTFAPERIKGRFEAPQGDGLLWLHANGNAFEVVLQPGEVIDVEPGSWIYRDASVGYGQQVYGLKTGILAGGGNIVFNRFTGPGRVGLQSGFHNLAAAEGQAAGGVAAGAGAVAALKIGSKLLGG